MKRTFRHYIGHVNWPGFIVVFMFFAAVAWPDRVRIGAVVLLFLVALPLIAGTGHIACEIAEDADEAH